VDNLGARFETTRVREIVPGLGSDEGAIGRGIGERGPPFLPQLTLIYTSSRVATRKGFVFGYPFTVSVSSSA